MSTIHFKRKSAVVAAMFLASALAVQAGGSCGSQAHVAAKADIVDTAVSAGQFGTLVAAVQAAGLVDALKGDGPFTVFAPSDAAFERLPIGTVESLLRPENRDKLTAILTYHVVPGRLASGDVVRRQTVPTLNGQRPRVSTDRGTVTIAGATIIETDIETSNGIIHVIDRVLLPTDQDLVSTAVQAGSFKTLAAALDAAGLISALQADGPFTVFAPTDEAFARLPEGAVESLLEPKNREKLAAILTYHVVPGAVYSDEAGSGSVETLQGSSLRVQAGRGGITVDQANVVTTDIQATNGVIHVIDTVIMPPAEHAEGHAAMQLIEQAIAMGAPMYNHGQADACAAMYTLAAKSLIEFEGTGLTGEDRTGLRSAMSRVGSTHDASDRAWIMRRALDDVYEALAVRVNTAIATSN